MVSINDVAKRAGVAKSTVSKVLNNYQMVSEETRRKVEEAVEELGYVPNSIAVSLSKKSFNRVGLIIDIQHQRQFVDEIGMQHLTGAFDKSKEYGIDVVTFFSSQFEGMSSRDIKGYLKSQRINCLILYNLSVEDKNLKELIDKEEFYCVLVDAPYVNAMTSSVIIDHAQAQYDVAKKTVTENTIANRVLYIAGGKQGYISETRMKGMEALHKELKFDLFIEYGEFNEAKARDIVFNYAKKVDVIVCASDLMAIGSVFALTELDIFHPVCGFDGITLMGYTQIAMNTVRQDFYLKSQKAFDELKRLLDGKTGRKRVLPYEVCTIRYMDIIQHN